MVKTGEWETVNKANAIWARAKKDISQEQYDDFYKQISHDFEAPLAHTHNRVEGSTEYTQLLYIPGKAPMDLYNREKTAGIKLYVKRVFIMDEAEALMPTYLRFVKGVVDSADLPLNVSPEDAAESFKPTLAKLKEALQDKAEDVRVTTRLVDSPACLVVKDDGMSTQLARILKQAGQKAPEVKPVLEVNADHPLVKKLDGSVHFHDLAHILFDQALLAEGGLPEDPAAYVKRVNALLA
jgi:HSP90 family molecular chaperone